VSACRASIKGVQAGATRANRRAFFACYHSTDAGAASDDCGCSGFATKLRFSMTRLTVCRYKRSRDDQ
jgi:hypothetical protein